METIFSHSLLLLMPAFGVHVSYACPRGFQPNAFVLQKARAMAREWGGGITACSSAISAAKKANALYTDVWTSMGFEQEERRERKPSRVSS